MPSTLSTLKDRIVTEGYDRMRSLRIRPVSERLWMCDSSQIVLIALLGGTNSAQGKFKFPVKTDTYVEWGNTGETPMTDSFTEAVLLPTTTGDDVDGLAVYAQETYDVADPTKFHPNLLIELPLPTASITATAVPRREQLLITAVDNTLKTITVVRGWGGSPVYAYADNWPIYIQASAGVEDQTWVGTRTVVPTFNKNYYQLFHAGWGRTTLAERMMKNTNYLVDTGNYEEMIRRVMGGTVGSKSVSGFLPMQLERQALYGMPFRGNPELGLPSTMGGIASFPINKLVYQLPSYENVSDVLQLLYNKGSQFDTCICSPDVKRMVSAWAQQRNMTDGRTSSEYGVIIDKIVTDFGSLDFVMHRSLRKGEMFVLDTAEVGMVEGWGFSEEELMVPDTTLVHKWQVTGYFTMAVACPSHHAQVQYSSLVGNDSLNSFTEYTEPVVADTLWPGEVQA